ncbi:MAG: VWA domain-containing protein [Chlamydiales bacterium]|nr:VWA domain-containing protein [Chlamydiales bacterium]
MNKLYSIIFTVFLSSQLLASSINLKINYQEATTKERVQQENTIVLPTNFEESCVSNLGMHKTLFAIKLSKLITTSLQDYHTARTNYNPDYPIYRPCQQAMLMPRPPICYWHEIRQEHADRLLRNIQELPLHTLYATDDDVVEAITMAKKLSTAMLSGETAPHFESMNTQAMHMKVAAAPASLQVTSGGVQDYSHFKKQVEDGFVPDTQSFIEEGFLSSFTLPLDGEPADQLISLNPAWGYDKAANKLYVQVGMNSNVTPETFKRRPLNLAFVIDISGSMAANDYTERSRLDWAKDAVLKALSHLTEQDILSIVVFDGTSEIIHNAAPVTDKNQIISKLQKIHPRGSTNLDAGLRDGYNEAAKSFKEEYENRVILFSDAGLNTGITDTASILRLVSDQASDGIGLTAIGVGENFHHDFIHKITMSKGGNALFVHTGADLAKFFTNFDYLVTPVAYNLKVQASMTDFAAKLVKTYGVPMLKNEPTQELINVRTLFLSESGGAIVLEYSL